MKKSRAKAGEVTPKSSAQGQGEEKLSLSWLMEDLVREVAGEIEAFSARIGLHIMQAVMEHEVSDKIGVWGQQRRFTDFSANFISRLFIASGVARSASEINNKRSKYP